MSLSFTKMHGTGNDVILLDFVSARLPENLPDLARKLCHRHFGIGADQLLAVLPSGKGDLRMDIYNADGSQVEMCGNGIRCFVKYALDNKLTRKTELRVETLAGIIIPRVIPDHPLKTRDTLWVEVDMGQPELEGEKIPVMQKGQVIGRDFFLESDCLLPGDPDHVMMTCVSMGNPHAVIFTDNIDKYPVARIGAVLENHPFFPNRVNVEFVQVKSRTHLSQRTWERGAGETLACGTGASAACVAGVLNGVTERKVTITLPGGDLELSWDAKTNHVFKTGPATTVFTGTMELESGYKAQFGSQVARLRL